MTKITEAPAFECPDFPQENFNVNFRIVSSYQIATDSVLTRFDAMVGEMKVPDAWKRQIISSGRKQFTVAINSTAPGESALMTPKGGVLGCMAIQTTAKELCAALRGLADAIEQNMPVNPGELK